MKPKHISFLSFVLCAALLIGITTSYAANNITLTAVNDSFLPLSSSTMPEKRGGAQYVPYSVFSGALGISGAYNSADQTLSLSSGTTVLRFDLSRGTVYDQNMNSYTTPAYWIHGSIYVPVKLVCGKFDLTYSNISAAAPILRICSRAAALSDSAFVSSSASTIRSMLEGYHKPAGNSSATPQGETSQISRRCPIAGSTAHCPAAKAQPSLSDLLRRSRFRYALHLDHTRTSRAICCLFYPCGRHRAQRGAAAPNRRTRTYRWFYSAFLCPGHDWKAPCSQ